jgi:5-methylcytosine-specific restriction endonuclease McrA
MDTLVLNFKGYPVDKIDWQRALTLLWQTEQAQEDQRRGVPVERACPRCKNVKGFVNLCPRCGSKMEVTMLKVEVVEFHENRTIRSATREWAVPSILRFVKTVTRDKKAIKFSRENIWLRDGGKCMYCSRPVTLDDFTFDHVLPRRLGGKTTWENIVACCSGCNSEKSGRTPRQAGMLLRMAPVKPTKLPDMGRMKFTWRPGEPSSWKGYMRDVTYWKDELLP